MTAFPIMDAVSKAQAACAPEFASLDGRDRGMEASAALRLAAQLPAIRDAAIALARDGMSNTSQDIAAELLDWCSNAESYIRLAKQEFGL